MRNNKLTKLLMGVLMIPILHFTSCEKEDSFKTESDLSGNPFIVSRTGAFSGVSVSESNGVLHFSCYEDFEKAMDIMDDLMDDAPKSEFDNQLVFELFEEPFNYFSFRSVLQNQQAIWEQENKGNIYGNFNSSPIAESPIFDDNLATLVNSNQLVYINGTLIKFLSEDEIIEVINPSPSDEAGLQQVWSKQDADVLGPRFLAHDLGGQFSDSVFMRNDIVSGQYLIFSPVRVACSQSWVLTNSRTGLSINGNDNYLTVTGLPGDEIKGTLTYIFEGESFSESFKFRLASCPIQEPDLFLGKNLSCQLAEFSWDIPVVPVGVSNFGALLDYGDGTSEGFATGGVNGTVKHSEKAYTRNLSDNPKIIFIFSKINLPPGMMPDQQTLSTILGSLGYDQNSGDQSNGEFCTLTIELEKEELGISTQGCCVDGDSKRLSASAGFENSDTIDDRWIEVGGKMFQAGWSKKRVRTRNVIKIISFKESDGREYRYLQPGLNGAFAVSTTVGHQTARCAVISPLPPTDISGIKDFEIRKRKVRTYRESYKAIELFAAGDANERTRLNAAIEGVGYIGIDFGNNEDASIIGDLSTFGCSLSSTDYKRCMIRQGPVKN